MRLDGHALDLLVVQKQGDAPAQPLRAALRYMVGSGSSICAGSRATRAEHGAEALGMSAGGRGWVTTAASRGRCSPIDRPPRP